MALTSTHYIIMLFFYFIVSFLVILYKKSSLLSSILYLRKKFFVNNTIPRCGLFPIIILTENPTKYKIDYNMFVYLSGLLCLLIIFIVFYRHIIYRFLYYIFSVLYQFSFIQKIIHNYCFFMICIKGLFEMDYYLLPFIFIIPNGLFLFDMITNWVPDLNNPLYLGAFYISIGIYLISLDELASNFSNKISTEPNHFLVVNYLKWLGTKEITTNSFYYQKGLASGSIKLSAAGQAAIFGGILTLATGIAVASINGYSNYKIQATQAQADVAKAQAQADVAKAQAQAEAVKAKAKAKAQAEAAKAKYAYKTAKVETNYKQSQQGQWWNPFKKPPTK